MNVRPQNVNISAFENASVSSSNKYTHGHENESLTRIFSFILYIDLLLKYTA